MKRFNCFDLGTAWAEAVRDNWDYSIVIDGRKGTGKTTLAAWLAYSASLYPREAEDKYVEFFTKILKENTVFAGPIDRQLDQIKAQLYQGKRYAPILVDETKSFYKQRFAMDASIQLSTLLGECRKAISKDEFGNVRQSGNRIFLFCIDSFLDVVKGVRDSFNVWLRCMDKGAAAMFISDPTPNPDKFFTEMFQKEKMKVLSKNWDGIASLLNVNSQIRLYSKVPSFAGIVTFPKLPAAVEELYIQMDGEAKLSIPTKVQDLKQRERKEIAMNTVLLKMMKELYSSGVIEKKLAEAGIKYSDSAINDRLSKEKTPNT